MPFAYGRHPSSYHRDAFITTNQNHPGRGYYLNPPPHLNEPPPRSYNIVSSASPMSRGASSSAKEPKSSLKIKLKSEALKLAQMREFCQSTLFDPRGDKPMSHQRGSGNPPPPNKKQPVDPLAHHGGLTNNASLQHRKPIHGLANLMPQYKKHVNPMNDHHGRGLANPHKKPINKVKPVKNTCGSSHLGGGGLNKPTVSSQRAFDYNSSQRKRPAHDEVSGLPVNISDNSNQTIRPETSLDNNRSAVDLAQVQIKKSTDGALPPRRHSVAAEQREESPPLPPEPPLRRHSVAASNDNIAINVQDPLSLIHI